MLVYTKKYRIEGFVYMIPGTRLTDILNVKIKDFIPMTEAKIIDDATNAVYAEIPYVAIYRDS